MSRTIRFALLVAVASMMSPTRARADRQTVLICVVPIPHGEPAMPNRFELNVDDYGGWHGALAYCRDVLGGHPDQSGKR